MGKRNAIVVLSSDDEKTDGCITSNRSSSKLKSRTFARSTSPRLTKRPRLSGSKSCSSKEHSNARLSFEKFDEVLNGLKVSSTGFESSKTKELWVEKHKPHSLEELSVQKKKVDEVKMWLEQRLRTPKDYFNDQVLLVTGQAGVGKSATLEAVASHLGARLCEWNAPTPTIWQEHMHNSNSGLRYTSKLDEFESFVDRARKYGFISSCTLGESNSATILVIDDLPVTSGRSAFERLKRCLLLLVRSAQIPTVILLTDYGEADSADHTARCLEQLQMSLESAGASKVGFNPITVNSIKKTLLRICRQEHCNMSAEEIDLIAKVSGGDIRHAITSIQLFSLRPKPKVNRSLSRSSNSYSKEKEKELNAMENGFFSHFGRDETLSLFHALGKFLHNKRESENGIVSSQIEFLLQDKYSRLPIKMDAPEKVLSQAHGQARPITDFLHENVLDFISDEAIDDAWAVSSYLGDADLLIASFRGIYSKHNEVENVLQSAAASVAVRGVLYGNNHPLPSRWHAIRKPKLWQIEQSSLQNKNTITRHRFNGSDGLGLYKTSTLATEYNPVLKWLGFRDAGGLGSHAPSREIACDNLGRMCLDGQQSEVSDDEIEEW